MQGGRFDQSIAYLRHYTQVSPDAQGFALLGQAYSRVHDYSGARDACGKSFELQRSPATLSCVAGADYELKNYKEAAQIFDVLDHAAKGFLDANPPLLYMAAKSYAAANQCTKSVAAYKRLLPMMKKGTKDYTAVQKGSQDSCKPAATEALRLKFVVDPLYGDHLRHALHPERPERVEAVAQRLRENGVLKSELAGARRKR